MLMYFSWRFSRSLKHLLSNKFITSQNIRFLESKSLYVSSRDSTVGTLSQSSKLDPHCVILDHMKMVPLRQW